MDFPWISGASAPLEHDWTEAWSGSAPSSVRLFRGNDAVNGVELEDGEAGNSLGVYIQCEGPVR